MAEEAEEGASVIVPVYVEPAESVAIVGTRVCVTPPTTVVWTGKGTMVALLDVVLLTVVLKDDDSDEAEADVELRVSLPAESDEVLLEDDTDVAEENAVVRMMELLFNVADEDAVVRTMELLFDIATAAVVVLESRAVLLFDSVVGPATESVVEPMEVLLSEIAELTEVLCAVVDTNKGLELLYAVACTAEEKVVLLMEPLDMVVLLYWAAPPVEKKKQLNKPTATAESAI